MDYREFEPAEQLRPYLKTGWTLETGGTERDWFSHIATPDGCVEIIRRVRGRSIWQEEQPPCFFAGIITKPTELRLGGEASFIGLRLWPWAWNALGRFPSAGYLESWVALENGFLPCSIEDAMGSLAFRMDAETRSIGAAVLSSRSVSELIQRTGRSRRSLQRWFEKQIGLPPRTYLRLLRFQETLVGLAASDGSLADHAAAHGFADQAHMAREFRSMAGAPASKTRSTACPPFVQSADPSVRTDT